MMTMMVEVVVVDHEVMRVMVVVVVVVKLVVVLVVKMVVVVVVKMVVVAYSTSQCHCLWKAQDRQTRQTFARMIPPGWHQKH